MAKDMNDMFDEMLDLQAEVTPEEQKEKEEAVDLLTKFKDYIQSARFDNACRNKANELGISDYKIIKRGRTSAILGKIADTLNITINIVGDIITYAVNFLASLIKSIINFAISAVRGVVNVFTLNCGTC